MKKSIIYLICILMIFSLLLSACGRNADNNEDNHIETPKDSSKLQDSYEEGKNNDKEIESDENNVDKKNEGNKEGKKEYPLTIIDMSGNKVKLEKKPEKIAVISGKLLELFYSAGGVSICGVVHEDGKSVNDNMKDLPTIGKESNPDIIEILELEPDIVFIEVGLQNAIASHLKKNDIVVVSLESGSEDKNKEAIRIMKEAAGIE